MINYQALKNVPNNLMTEDQNAPKVKVIRYTSLN